MTVGAGHGEDGAGEESVEGQDPQGGEALAQDDYYIYGLVDPQALHETGGDPLLSIFYVGKGRGSRWDQHEKEVRKALAREEFLLERRSSKGQRIHMILDRGQRVPALRLSAGYRDEKDAYHAEALAIDTVGAALAAARRPPLTNATPGHHAGFLWLQEHFVFTETIEQDLVPDGAVPDAGAPDGAADSSVHAAEAEILVKGTAQEMVSPAQRLAPPRSLPAGLLSVEQRVTVFDLLGEDQPGRISRRAWDPYDPWTDLEARERARRYWPIAARTVASWISEPTGMPARLFLGIPEPGGRTVIRYAWEVDREGVWELYAATGRWGIPLGDRVRDHRWLGTCLYETRNGRRVQVLYGYASGIRVLDGPSGERAVGS